MSSLTTKQIRENITEGEALKQLTQIYSELSAAKLNKIRAIIEKNNVFAGELAQVYHLVQTEASKVKQSIQDTRSGTILILITSNDRFYGSLENPLIRYFIDQTNENNIKKYAGPVTRIVLGKTGFNYFKAIGKLQGYEFLALKEDLPNFEELQALSGKMKPFKSAHVFHPHFKSVLSQLPMITDISQSTGSLGSPPEKGAKNQFQEAFRISNATTIFEPETDKILEFFDTQIKKLLFENTFLESELSRTASRLITMDQAQSNANSYIKDEKILLGSAKRSQSNIRVLEISSAFRNWRKKNNRQN